MFLVFRYLAAYPGGLAREHRRKCGFDVLFTTHTISPRLLNRVAELSCDLGKIDLLVELGVSLETPRLTATHGFLRCVSLCVEAAGYPSDHAEGAPGSLEPLVAELFERVRSGTFGKPCLSEGLLAWHGRFCELLGLRRREPARCGFRRRRESRIDWTTTSGALIVGPPPEEILGDLEKLQDWLVLPVEGRATAFLKAGTAFHCILRIQPFLVLNELMAYLVALDTLGGTGVNGHSLLTCEPLLSDLSALFSAFDEGTWSGDLTRWLEFFVDAVRSQVGEVTRGLLRDHAKLAPVAVPEPLEPGLNDRQIRALSLLRTSGRLTNREYRKLFSVSNKTAHQELRILVDRRMVRRVGFGRSVEYLPVARQ